MSAPQPAGGGPATARFIFVESPADFRDPAAMVARVPRGVRSRHKLLAILADKLRFPRYFGHNWDALEDCLRDLSWLPSEQPVAIVHQDFPFGDGGEQRAIYLDILANAAGHWASHSPGKLCVLFPQAPANAS